MFAQAVVLSVPALFFFRDKKPYLYGSEVFLTRLVFLYFFLPTLYSYFAGPLKRE